ncbi:MAG TPA: tyrosine-type recombinase/integrase [Cellvibrio sp.]|nr:tyrosine-type recombinase/integrase [Cellvibrio sp.]
MLQTLLQKRSNGYYYFRWVCPPAIGKLLGKREIVKSLRTTSKLQALARAGAYYMAVDKLKEVSLTPKKGVLDLDAILRDVDGIYSEFYERTVMRSFATYLNLCELYSASSIAEARQKQSDLLKLLEAHRLAATNHLGEYEVGISIFDRVKSILEKVANFYQGNSLEAHIESLLNAPDHVSVEGLYASAEQISYRLFASFGEVFIESDKWYSKYIYDLTQIFFRSYEIKKDRLDPSKAAPSLPVIQIPSDLKGTVIEQDGNSLLFSELFEEFMAHKIANKLSDKLSKNYRADFPIFLHFIGNKPIDKIVRRDVRTCLLSCLKFPRRNLRPYLGLPIAELAAMEVPESDWLSDRSVLNFKKLLQGIFAYAKEQEYIRESPAVDLKLDLKLKKNRTHFHVHEVVKLLNVALENKHEWRKWFVLLAAYTGARRGEIAQLRVSDFKIDEASGIRYLLITDEEGDLKTDNALRRVPLHEKLIELGLDEFLSGVDIRLFPEKADNAMTRHFPLIMDAAGVIKTNELKQNRTLHSLRHSFITQTLENGFTHALVQSIAGHEITSTGQTQVYTAEFSVNKLLPVVNSLQYL